MRLITRADGVPAHPRSLALARQRARTSARDSFSAFPALSTKGTPAQRGLCILTTAAANVSVVDCLLVMESSSKYPAYWPTTRSRRAMGRTHLSTLIFSCRMCFASIESGCSIATSARICVRWFCITSRITPYWSKYPPRPSSPTRSCGRPRARARGRGGRGGRGGGVRGARGRGGGGASARRGERRARSAEPTARTVGAGRRPLRRARRAEPRARAHLEDHLDRGDVLPVPDGLEADVGEAQHE